MRGAMVMGLCLTTGAYSLAMITHSKLFMIWYRVNVFPQYATTVPDEIRNLDMEKYAMRFNSWFHAQS